MSEKTVLYFHDYVLNACKGRPECHGYQHAIDVLEYSKKIAKAEGIAYRPAMEVIALCHDVFDHKFAKEHATRASRLSFTFLCVSNGFSPSEEEFILSEIDKISYSKGGVPDSVEGKIVQDADRLTALGMLGIFRTFVYSGTHQLNLEDSYNHFHEKLVKLPDLMNFESSKRLADELLRNMKVVFGLYVSEKENIEHVLNEVI